nr:ASCH domain-containing protein [Bacilli bacterium]
MKVLTIKQPYASMIINNYKKYEFRSWKTNYRGKLLIHAGGTIDKKDMKYFSYLNILEYPTKCIIGECELVDCIPINDEFDKYLYNLDDKIYGRHS